MKNLFDICRLHDIILRVNEMDFTQIEHQAAVDGLKAAGVRVHLVSQYECRISIKCLVHLVNSSSGSARHGRNSIKQTTNLSFRIFNCWWYQSRTCQRVCIISCYLSEGKQTMFFCF